MIGTNKLGLKTRDILNSFRELRKEKLNSKLKIISARNEVIQHSPGFLGPAIPFPLKELSKENQENPTANFLISSPEIISVTQCCAF